MNCACLRGRSQNAKSCGEGISNGSQTNTKIIKCMGVVCVN
uniref:Uncharacterized protein n=1 Tax=Arundo donax TaxID=35708 RepID=A0A0A9BP47_ARUDO